MDSPQGFTTCISLKTGLMLALATSLPSAALAADAHQGVQAKPGEIVLLRNVAARPAYRLAPPGMALIVDPSPERELARALDPDELSEADYASLDASSSRDRGHATTVGNAVGVALGGSVASGLVGERAAGTGFSSLVAGPTGAIGRATGNIDNQVRGALSELPGVAPPAVGGH